MARTRSQRLERRLIVFGILSVVLGAWALLRASPVEGISRGPLLPGFDKAAVQEVIISQTDPEKKQTRTLRLLRGSEGWTLPDRFGHAALPGSVTMLLDDITAARETAPITKQADTFDKYRRSEGWVTITLKDDAGKEISQFHVGRDDRDRNDLFVRRTRGGTEGIVRVVDFRPKLASVEPSKWIETRIWDQELRMSAIARVDIRQRDAEKPITLVRRGASSRTLGVAVPDKVLDAPEKVWWMASPRNIDADTMQVQGVLSAMANLRVQDVVARSPAGNEAEFGFDAPEAHVTMWLDGEQQMKKVELLVGLQTEGGAWHVRRAGTPWVYVVPAGQAINAVRAEPQSFMAAEEAPTDGTEPK